MGGGRRRTGPAVVALVVALSAGCGQPTATSVPAVQGTAITGTPSSTAEASSATPASPAPAPSETPVSGEPELPVELVLGQTFGVVYDPLLERVALVNGAPEAGPEQPTELWSWSGTTWELIDAAGPPARNFAAIGRDPVRGVTVVVGGLRERTSTFDQTLEWDGRDWTTHDTPGAGPGPREGAGLAYDAASASMLLFGGAVGFEQRPDTWSWDGAAWTKRGGVGPQPRFVSLLTADGSTGEVILQGGHWVDGNDGGFLADTWRWTDGPGSWQEVPGAEAEGPGPRVNSPGVWHPRLEGILMFGGGTGFESPLAADTWLWRDGAWTELETATAPSARNGHAMAYDEARDVVVLVGGIGEPGGRQVLDVWEFDGQDWREALPAG